MAFIRGKRIMWSVIGVLLILSLLLGFGCAAPAPTPAPTPTPTPAAPEVIKWKGQTVYPILPPYSAGPGHSVKHPGTAGLSQTWNDWVYEATGGRLDIEIAPVGTYGGAMEMFDLVQTGAIDYCGVYYGGYCAGIVPEGNVEVGMPFAWEYDYETWDAYVHWGMFEEIQAAYAEHGIKWFPTFAGLRGYHFATTFPCYSVDDLAGKKLRALGVYGDYVKNLGGSPVVVAAPEMYMAMKLGTVDGGICSLDWLEGFKFKEVAKYWVMQPNTSSLCASMIINMDSWNALPEDIKVMLQRDTIHVIYGASSTMTIMQTYDLAAAIKDYGLKPVMWSDEDTARARAAGIATWDTIAEKSANCARLVGIVKAQAKALGKIE